MGEQATGTRADTPKELAALVEVRGFWRMVPEWVPRRFDEPTRELVERVAHGLRSTGA
ncbi:hypothetical protein [Streptomyces sp. NPDC088400]|uniref:hypothetical protein n=1 Tax=Streptomyces sp. NPDC088400 TaxID=3365861 RepID=UPI003812AF79|nr:hypothetical protein OH820_22030 [Streptomyces sp. NBC_00857]